MKYQLFATPALALFVAALVACSPAPAAPSGVATSAPAATPASATVSPPANQPAHTQPSSAAITAPTQPTAAAAAASAAAPTKRAASVPFPSSAGLDQLDSYNLTLRVSFKGTRDAQTVTVTDFFTRSFSLNPAAQFATIQTTGDDGKPAILVQGRVDDVQYARTGADEPCTARTATSAGRRIFNPVVLLKPFFQGKDVGPETVNGLPTRHYVMEALRNADTEMSAEVWIAEKNAYVVKYALLVKGGEAYFGKGSKGEQTLAFELRDVGAKKTVAIPNGCLPSITDLPAMPDAANVKRSLMELNYTTVSGIAKTAAFYQEQMKALGWTLESIPTQPPAGEPAIPNLPQLPQVPGVDIRQYLPTAAAPPPLQYSWLVFRRASEQRRVHVTIQPEGANWRVVAEIVQE